MASQAKSSPARVLLVLPDPGLTRAAVRSGLDVWLILGDGAAAPDFRVGADRLIRVDESDQKALMSAVIDTIAKHDIAYALDANGTPLDGNASASGNQPDNKSRPAGLLNDVHAMRSVLYQSGLWCFGTYRADTARGAAEIAKDLGFTAVISSAETDISIVRSAAELAAWQATREADATPGPYVVEECLAGPRLAVTTLTVDGMHSVVGIAAWQSSPFAPGFVYPAALPEADQKSARAATRSLLDLVGYQFGPAQTSIILTSRGPQIVRSRSQFGAHQVPRLIQLATGLDVRTELFRTLAGAPFRAPDPRWFAAIGFLGDSARRRPALADEARILALPGVSELHLATARENAPTTGAGGTSHPYVITEGVSLAAVTDNLAAVRRMLGGEYRPPSSTTPATFQ